MPTIRSQTKWNATAAFLVWLLFSVTALDAATPSQLWPTFSEPSTIVNVGFSGQAVDDYMPITSFQGAFNQQQLSTRLYVNSAGDANYWLAHAVPSGVTVSQLSYNSSDPDGTLKSLLSTYGSSIKGYYVCDPYDAPESCNMATTLAGINDAMVVTADNLAIMLNSTYNSHLPLMINGDLRTYSVPTSGEYTWIGSNSSLVDSATINRIDNPSGGMGTTGWSGTGTLSTTTYGGRRAIEWQLPANQGTDSWVSFDPASVRVNSTPYIFSFQVAGSGTVFLDAWNGCGDVQSGTVTLNSSYRTLQLAVPIPLSGCSGNSPIKLEVRAHTQSSAVTAYFNNAAVIDNRVAIDTYQYNNFISRTNPSIVAQDFPGSGNLRDYQIAAKMFVFDLTSDDADEKTLYGEIIDHTPHNTPVMGYVDNEGHDVLYLSGSGEGHFLNASDDYDNGSVWASLPQPSSLSQPAPTPLKTYKGTVYLAFAASDGDNSSIIEHQNVQRWTEGQFVGAVPMGWTMSPGMIDFAPGIISNYYRFLPQSQEIMAGPSGVGYGTGESGSDLSTFASLTNQFMTAEGMSSVTDWESPTVSGGLGGFANDVDVPHVVYVHSQAYTSESNGAHTVLDGQNTFYDSNPPDQIAAIENELGSRGSARYQSGSPNFIEALLDNLTLSQDDTLYIAQKLQRDESYPFVLMTPSELAAAEYASHNGGGTATSSPQAVLAATLQAAFPQNFIWNANGQEPWSGIASSGWAIGGGGHSEALYSNRDFLGVGNEEFHVPANTGANSYVYEHLKATSNVGAELVAGRIYRFSVNVAGTGSAYLTVFDGTSNHTSATVALSPTGWTNISMIVQMQSATTGQMQIVVPASASAQTLYFSASTAMQPGWYYGATQGSGTSSTVSFGSGTYASAQGKAQALYFNNPANDGVQWMNFYPTGLTSGTTYIGSVDVAGTGQAYLAFYNGSGGTNSSTVTLSNNWQTLTLSAAASGSGPPRFQVVVPSSSSNQTVYFRNASLTPAPSNAPLFTTGLESGQTQLSYTNTVDSTSPGGGESNVGSAILESTTTASHGGTYAVQYGGAASGGSSTHAYMEAFTNSSTLSSASRLSYWIYPMTPMGSEPGASAMTGLNSTCAAIDIIFTNRKALRNLGVQDQFGNTLNPAGECNHLQPDQWNYVTVDLSSLSGLTVARIDVGYDQPGASGNYGGYIDDISLTH